MSLNEQSLDVGERPHLKNIYRPVANDVNINNNLINPDKEKKKEEILNQILKKLIFIFNKYT